MEYDTAYEYTECEVVDVNGTKYLIGEDESGYISIEQGEVIPAEGLGNEDGDEELFWSYVANDTPEGTSVNAVNLDPAAAEVVGSFA